MRFYSGAILRAIINRVHKLAGADPLDDKASLRTELKQAGQIVVIFALMLTVLIGLVGIAIDSTYSWRESLRVQRAADAGSLAGVVYMPGNDGGALAKSTAKAETAKNGYPIAGTTTIDFPPAADPRELDVSLTTQVPTFFARIFGINNFTVTRSSKAIYVTPVPMGSPLGYYGVYQLCPVSGTCITQPKTLETGGNLTVSISSQGFFGAIEGEGSNRSTGDAYATYYNPNPTTNSQYTKDGYRYEVTAATSGKVYLFDPVFCPTSTKTGTGSGGHSGAGDHWLGTTATAVSTYYILWDTHNTPLATKTWTNVAELDQNDPVQVDKGGTYGGSDYSDGTEPSSPADCANDPHHNKWVALGSVTAGSTYSLQVTTTNPNNLTANLNQSFENMFSIAVSGAGNTVHGTGSMVTYANVDSGSSEFYLAQIDRTSGAGKTIEIDLFDPGDVGAGAWLQIEPDGSPAWQPTKFSYTSDGNSSPPNRSSATGGTTCLQTYGGSGTPPSGCGETATSGGQFYQNSWVQIFITLPTTYGDATHPLTQSGWWKIKYIVAQANDTTTWQVSIRGNPVHLI
jgi:hypothetical protein